MSAVVLPFEMPGLRTPRIGELRVNGGVSLIVGVRDGVSHVRDVRERDGYKLRTPRARDAVEAVIINTGGGVAGGDVVAHSVRVEAGAKAAVASQSAERIYRALDRRETRIAVALDVAVGADLAWLPQETILFDAASVARTIRADVTAGGKLVAAETTVFGRVAMGESVSTGGFRDNWRIRYADRLVFAESVRIEGDIAAQLSSRPVADGGHVVSTLIYVGEDAVDRLERVRATLHEAACEAAASAWGRVLLVRMLGFSSEVVRAALVKLLPVVTGAAPPRVWAS